MPNLITTFEKIKSHDPCGQKPEDNCGWNLLCKNLNPERDMEKKVTLLDILESNDIRDAIWSLRCWKYKEYCLLLADIAESVLHIFEKKHPDDKRPRIAIEAIRNFKAGKITEKELKLASFYAFSFYAFSSYALSSYASLASSYASLASSYAGYTSYAAGDAYSFTDYAVAREKQWDIIEKLMREFIKS